MGPRHHTQEESDWPDISQESSQRRSKKEEKRKRKLWEEEDTDDSFDSWDNDEFDTY